MKNEAIIIEGHAGALANYPHARRVGNMLFISGCSSRRADNTHVGVTKNADGSVALDVAEQTRGVIRNIETVVTAAGGSLSDVVDLTTFLVNMKDYPGYNEAYNEFFDAQAGPSRTTVAVAQLPHPHLLIEIKAIAVLND